jgi:hypothetical protein
MQLLPARLRLVGAAALVLIIAGAAVAVVAPRVGSAPKEAPFGLDGQPAETIAGYGFAVAHEELVAAIPCYCGCGQSLGHRSLLDCFLQPGGAGYESHASGCVICLREAADIDRLSQEGLTTDDIRDWIDQEYRKYGPPTRAEAG